jgi:hypothetical protein
MPSLLDDHHILAFIAEKERETPQCGLKLFCSPESKTVDMFVQLPESPPFLQHILGLGRKGLHLDCQISEYSKDPKW